MSAGDEAAGRVNNIPSVIAKDLVTDRMGNATLERDEEQNVWGWVPRSYRRVQSVWTKNNLR